MTWTSLTGARARWKHHSNGQPTRPIEGEVVGVSRVPTTSSMPGSTGWSVLVADKRGELHACDASDVVVTREDPQPDADGSKAALELRLEAYLASEFPGVVERRAPAAWAIALFEQFKIELQTAGEKADKLEADLSAARAEIAKLRKAAKKGKDPKAAEGGEEPTS